jgi:phage baseplate assembly protein gpV
MLIFGEIVALEDHKAKIKYRNNNQYETNWFYIPQLCTKTDKASNLMEIGTLVSAVINSNFDDGCIIGALYNDEDLSITKDRNIKSIKFSDGTLLQYDKKNHIFTLDIKGQTNITSSKVIINGDLEVTGNISDKKGSMQEIRNIYNSHTHGNSSTPNGEM